MAKKILSVLLCLVLVFGLVVSVSASGGSSGSDRYAPIPFQEVQMGTGYREFTEWNAAQTKTGRDSTVTTTDFGTQVVSADTGILWEFYTDASRYSIRLYGHDLVLNLDQLTQFAVYTDADDPQSCSVDFSAVVQVPVLSAGKWQLTNRSVNISRKLSETGSHDIASDIKAVISSATSSDIVLLSSVSIVITTGADVSAGYFEVRMNAVDRLFSVSAFYNSYDMRAEIVSSSSAVSFVDWLVDAVGAFLDFELFPGMSLNGIIQFVVVVGFVFWFITLLI